MRISLPLYCANPPAPSADDKAPCVSVLAGKNELPNVTLPLDMAEEHLNLKISIDTPLPTTYMILASEESICVYTLHTSVVIFVMTTSSGICTVEKFKNFQDDQLPPDCTRLAHKVNDENSCQP